MRRAEVSELLHQDRLLDLARPQVRAPDPVVGILARVDPVLVAAGVQDRSTEPGRVVTSGEVHLGLQVVGSDPDGDRVERRDVIGRVHPGRGAGEEPACRLVPAIVHHRVEHVALEPRRRVPHPVGPCLPPHFAHQVGIGVDVADEAPVLAPEVERHHVRHVEAETVDPVRRIAIPVRVEPSARHVEHQLANRGYERARDRSARCAFRAPRLLPLRQIRHSGPTGIGELAGVRRGRIVEHLDLVPPGVRRFRPVLEQVLPGPERRPGVVPGVVEDDAHVPTVDLVHEREEQAIGRRPGPGGRVSGILGRHPLLIAPRVRSEVAVHVTVVAGVVLVQRGGVVDRVEEQRRHAQVLQVIELIDDALQVASVATQLDRPVERLARGLGPRLPGGTSPGSRMWAPSPRAGYPATLPRCRARWGRSTGRRSGNAPRRSGTRSRPPPRRGRPDRRPAQTRRRSPRGGLCTQAPGTGRRRRGPV